MKTFNLIVSDQQLQVIARVLAANPQPDVDEFGGNVASVLVDMIELTLKDPDYDPKMIHGFVL